MTSADTIDIGDETASGVVTEAQPLLSRVDRAAVLLLLLSDDEAASLLARLGPVELEQIGAAMCELGEIDKAAMAEALDDFVSESAREVISKQDRATQIRTLL